MDFSEVSKELGGLTADQVCELANFGKSVLETAGVVGLSSGIIGLVRSLLLAENFDLEENKSTIETLLHIANEANELNEKCWGERKTMLGLTGVNSDDEYFGLNGATRIEAA